MATNGGGTAGRIRKWQMITYNTLTAPSLDFVTSFELLRLN